MRLISCIFLVTNVIYLCGALPVDTVSSLKDSILKAGSESNPLSDFAEYIMNLKLRSSRSQKDPKPSYSRSTLRRQHNNHYNGSNRPNPLRSSPHSSGTSLSSAYMELQRQKAINANMRWRIEQLEKHIEAQEQIDVNQIREPLLGKPNLEHEMSFVPIRQSHLLREQQQALHSINYPIAVPAGKHHGKDSSDAEENYGIFTTMYKWFDAGRTLVTLPMGLFSMVAEVARYIDRSEMVENIKDGIVGRIFGDSGEDPFVQ